MRVFDSIDLTEVAEKYGTPCYIYSAETIDRQCEDLREAFHSHPTLLCFAVKANTTRAILTRIFSHGFGADIVSGGELHRSLRAGVVPEKVVFSGVGKQDWEIELAIEKEIGAFNVESTDELRQIERLAKKVGKTPTVLLRINPNIPVDTNPYIATGLYSTKFGIGEENLAETIAVLKECPSLVMRGLSTHLGSQITDLATFEQAAMRMVKLCADLKKTFPKIDRVDLGGGLAVRYHHEKPPPVKDYADTVLKIVSQAGLNLILEPGRWVIAESGALLTRVIGTKSNPEKNFAIVDAAMNDLIRPSLYEAYHPVAPVEPRSGENLSYDIVGPICETGDFLALSRSLSPLAAGDLLLIGVAGAYGSTMASNYNSRLKAPEVWVENGQTRLIRQREPLESLWSFET